MAAGYSGTPLARKLGIGDGTRVLLVGAPRELDLELPDGIRPVLHRRRGAGDYQVVLLFAPDERTLRARFAGLVPDVTTAGALWVCWPKRTGAMASDLSERAVRDHGLSIGLVDVKVAAVDPIWSALKFVRRSSDR
ncbi:MAG: hypothetical protein QOE97_1446 [Pseudonocardiales bacterium]|jgi:hypothetical protein|nr:hypothetical protein [Pseudonocardiales bacterium]